MVCVGVEVGLLLLLVVVVVVVLMFMGVVCCQLVGCCRGGYVALHVCAPAIHPRLIDSEDILQSLYIHLLILLRLLSGGFLLYTILYYTVPLGHSSTHAASTSSRRPVLSLVRGGSAAPRAPTQVSTTGEGEHTPPPPFLTGGHMGGARDLSAICGDRVLLSH